MKYLNTVRLFIFMFIFMFIFSVILPVHATLITENFDVIVTEGDYGMGTEGFVSVTYNDDDVLDFGLDELISDEFDVEMVMFGQTFIKTDDVDYYISDYPTMSFRDGIIRAVNFVVGDYESAHNKTHLLDAGLDVLWINYYDTALGAFGANAEGGSSVVPEPSIIALMGLGLVGIFGVNCRKQKNK